MNKPFEAVPTEILLNILRQVERTRDLLNIALCSHQIFDLTAPYLYSHVVLNIRDKNRHPRSNHLEDFTSLVYEKPSIANHVRTLTLCDKWPNNVALGPPSKCYLTKEGVEAAKEELNSSLQRAVKSFSRSLQEEHTWIIDLTQMKHADAIIALLIPALTKLERLELPLAHAGFYYKRMIKRAMSNQEAVNIRPMFQSLQNVIYDWNIDLKGVSSDSVSLLFNLPSIRSIYGFMIGRMFDGPNQTLHNLKSGVSSLTYLELKECKICSQDIANMLRACKSLKTFILDRSPSLSEHDFINSGIIFRALQFTRKSLENLWIDHHFEEVYWDLDAGFPPALDSLAAFDMLKHVKIDIDFLFGDSTGGAYAMDYGLAELVLPTIQSLHITNCYCRKGFLVTWLTNLVGRRENIAPKLKEITIETNYARHAYECGGLKSLAQAQGIVVKELYEFDDSERFTRGWKVAGCTASKTR